MSSTLNRFCMKKFLCVLIPALLTLASCSDLENWTTSSSATLRFSSDTVAFDTVITGVASATQTLVAYNGASDGVRITQVSLGQGASSPFYVNVDGQYLYEGTGEDFEVRGKDSMYMRLFVNLPVTDSDEIEDVEDELIFTLESGVVQRVKLTSSGINVNVLEGETISSDQTLTTNRPYQIFDSLVVEPGVTLTLPAGCTLMFHDGAELVVHGTLLARGTVEEPVTLRGDRTDRMFSYLPYDNTPNRWGGVHFTSSSTGNVLTQVDLHSSDYGMQVDSCDYESLSAPVLTLENSVVHNIGGPGLTLQHTSAFVVGSQISNTLGDCVAVTGGDVQMVHCTVAQFYPFSANRGDAVYLQNVWDGGKPSLARFHMLNSVVTGYAEDVIMGYGLEDGEDGAQVDYLFQNSLLRTVYSQDTIRFKNVLYDQDTQSGGLTYTLDVVAADHFTTFDTYAFIYDFAPDSLSAIRGLADPTIAAQYATDRRGNSRLADGAPDAGAYEGQ